MKQPYASVLFLLLAGLSAPFGYAQGPKPQVSKQVRLSTVQPMGLGFSALLEDSRGGGLPDECIDAQVLTVGGTCTPVVISTVGATQSLAPILCNGFTSTTANDVWFTVTSISPSTIVEVLGTNDYDAVMEVFVGTCAGLISIGCVDNTFPPGSTLEVANLLGDPGGTFYIRVYAYTTPAPATMEFTICAYSGADPPSNDDCSGAIAQGLSAGNTVTFTGDNTGATEDLPGFTMVWEAFTTTACTDVVVNYCVPGSVFENFLINLSTNCVDILDGLLTGENDDCTVTFLSLPAGTYYVPVLVASDGTTPQGAYSISVSATACAPGYCAASADLCDEYIARVQFGTIDNTSGCSDGPVVNYTAISTSIATGEGLMMTVTNGPDVYVEDQVVVWVDWNQNESFFDAGESYALSSANGALTFTGMVTAPANATLGATRMRIRMMWTGTPSPCGGSEYGEVEDYTVNVIMGGGVDNDDCVDATTLTVSAPGACPGAAVSGDSGSATQDGGDTDCDATLTQFQDVWYTFNSGGNTQVTIDLTVGTLTDLVLDVLEGGCAGASVYCDIGTLTNLVDVDPNTDYIVRVASNNDFGVGGTFTICITGESVATGYCAAGADGTGLGLDERIINVTVAGINNNSPNVAPVAPAYVDYTSIVGTMQAGSTYPISIGVSSAIGTTYNTNQALVWIDLNQDEDFDDVGEQVYVSAIGAVNAYTGNITIPGGAMLGSTRMRIRLHDTYVGPDYINNLNATPCGVASYGEVEDYTIMIDGPTAIEEVMSGSWNVFPNPGNGDFTIQYAGDDALVRISLMDMAGRLVHGEQVHMSAGQLVPVSLAGRLAAGAYVLRLSSEKGNHEQRVVVR